MISLLPSVAPLNLSLLEGSSPAYTHCFAGHPLEHPLPLRSSVLSNAPLTLLYPPVTKYIWVNKTQLQYILQLTTYHLVVVVVIATTVESPRCLQAGQLSGHSIGVVHNNSGDVTRARATDASCYDDVVTAGLLDSTSISGLRYQLAISLNLSYCLRSRPVTPNVVRLSVS